MRVILKDYLRTRDNGQLFAYGRLLQQKGWIFLMMEGGYLSPDGSTMFIVNRSPYHGQLLQAAADRETEYLLISTTLKESGDFVLLGN